MRLYLDSADTDAWQELMPLGIFYGITTNPLLIERAGRSGSPDDLDVLVAMAKDLGAQQFHAQVSGAQNSYVDWSSQLYQLGNRHGIETVVKIPLVPEALARVAAIKELGGKILMTACYHANQGTIAAAVQADFIAPYVGRMAASGLDTDTHLQQLVGLRDHSVHPFQILCGSIKTADEIAELGAIGVDAVTLSPEVARELTNNRSSLAAFDEFENAAAKAANRS
jgi:transaldolase